MDDTMDAEALRRRGAAVRALRLAKGLSSMKRIEGISHQTLAQIERGGRVTTKSLRTVAALLGIPLNWVTEEEGLQRLEEAAQTGVVRDPGLAAASDSDLIELLHRISEELYRRHREGKVTTYLQRARDASDGSGVAAYPFPVEGQGNED